MNSLGQRISPAVLCDKLSGGRESEFGRLRYNILVAVAHAMTRCFQGAIIALKLSGSWPCHHFVQNRRGVGDVDITLWVRASSSSQVQELLQAIRVVFDRALRSVGAGAYFPFANPLELSPQRHYMVLGSVWGERSCICPMQFTGHVVLPQEDLPAQYTMNVDGVYIDLLDYSPAGFALCSMEKEAGIVALQRREITSSIAEKVYSQGWFRCLFFISVEGFSVASSQVYRTFYEKDKKQGNWLGALEEFLCKKIKSIDQSMQAKHIEYLILLAFLNALCFMSPQDPEYLCVMQAFVARACNREEAWMRALAESLPMYGLSACRFFLPYYSDTSERVLHLGEPALRCAMGEGWVIVPCGREEDISVACDLAKERGARVLQEGVCSSYIDCLCVASWVEESENRKNIEKAAHTLDSALLLSSVLFSSSVPALHKQAVYSWLLSLSSEILQSIVPLPRLPCFLGQYPDKPASFFYPLFSRLGYASALIDLCQENGSASAQTLLALCGYGIVDSSLFSSIKLPAQQDPRTYIVFPDCEEFSVEGEVQLAWDLHRQRATLLVQDYGHCYLQKAAAGDWKERCVAYLTQDLQKIGEVEALLEKNQRALAEGCLLTSCDLLWEDRVTILLQNSKKNLFLSLQAKEVAWKLFAKACVAQNVDSSLAKAVCLHFTDLEEQYVPLLEQMIETKGQELLSSDFWGFVLELMQHSSQSAISQMVVQAAMAYGDKSVLSKLSVLARNDWERFYWTRDKKYLDSIAQSGQLPLLPPEEQEMAWGYFWKKRKYQDCGTLLACMDPYREDCMEKALLLLSKNVPCLPFLLEHLPSASSSIRTKAYLDFPKEETLCAMLEKRGDFCPSAELYKQIQRRIEQVAKKGDLSQGISLCSLCENPYKGWGILFQFFPSSDCVATAMRQHGIDPTFVELGTDAARLGLALHFLEQEDMRKKGWPLWLSTLSKAKNVEQTVLLYLPYLEVNGEKIELFCHLPSSPEGRKMARMVWASMNVTRVEPEQWQSLLEARVLQADPFLWQEILQACPYREKQIPKGWEHLCAHRSVAGLLAESVLFYFPFLPSAEKVAFAANVLPHDVGVWQKVRPYMEEEELRSFSWNVTQIAHWLDVEPHSASQFLPFFSVYAMEKSIVEKMIPFLSSQEHAFLCDRYSSYPITGDAKRRDFLAFVQTVTIPGMFAHRLFLRRCIQEAAKVRPMTSSLQSWLQKSLALLLPYVEDFEKELVSFSLDWTSVFAYTYQGGNNAHGFLQKIVAKGKKEQIALIQYAKKQQEIPAFALPWLAYGASTMDAPTLTWCVDALCLACKEIQESSALSLWQQALVLRHEIDRLASLPVVQDSANEQACLSYLEYLSYCLQHNKEPAFSLAFSLQGGWTQEKVDIIAELFCTGKGPLTRLIALIVSQESYSAPPGIIEELRAIAYKLVETLYPADPKIRRKASFSVAEENIQIAFALLAQQSDIPFLWIHLCQYLPEVYVGEGGIMGSSVFMGALTGVFEASLAYVQPKVDLLIACACEDQTQNSPQSAAALAQARLEEKELFLAIPLLVEVLITLGPCGFSSSLQEEITAVLSAFFSCESMVRQSRLFVKKWYTQENVLQLFRALGGAPASMMRLRCLFLALSWGHFDRVPDVERAFLQDTLRRWAFSSFCDCMNVTEKNWEENKHDYGFVLSVVVHLWCSSDRALYPRMDPTVLVDYGFLVGKESFWEIYTSVLREEGLQQFYLSEQNRSKNWLKHHTYPFIEEKLALFFSDNGVKKKNQKKE